MPNAKLPVISDMTQNAQNNPVVNKNNAPDPDNLVWLDMEMTGLDCTQNVIIEVAVIITDKNLNVIEESESYAVAQPQEELDKMDKWNKSTHQKSGLITRVQNSPYTLAVIEEILLELLKRHIIKEKAPLCGNTIHQDRKFLCKYMPKFDDYLHYRNIDISTIEELARRWYPEIYNGFTKHNKHEALADIRESIAELQYYRDKIFIPS